MSHKIDINHLRGWIGREENVADHLTPALVQKFHATIDLPGKPPCVGDAAPRLIHFCLCQPVVGMNNLGADGHPARGGFLPPVPLPRRMWAGSDITFSGDLIVGEAVNRRSTVVDIVVKEGRSGTLCFVTVEHQISGDKSGVVATELQSIVYRDMDGGSSGSSAQPAPDGANKAEVLPSPTLLFRYSALTFNGHRIHYDEPYATQIEGYPGLVVHGPLQATLLLHFAAKLADGVPPDGFVFRSTSTIFAGEEMLLLADGMVPNGTNRHMKLWTARKGGPVAMQAEASWK